MGAMHKMSLDFYEDSFAIIALHCSLEDFSLAYTINKYLKCRFKRRKKDLVFSERISFPVFEWKDEVNDRYWTMIQNNIRTEEPNIQNGFFKDTSSFTTKCLIPEYKNVDYFLKLEQEDLELEKTMVKRILSMPKIVTAYTIQTSHIKSKNNLIF